MDMIRRYAGVTASRASVGHCGVRGGCRSPPSRPGPAARMARSCGRIPWIIATNRKPRGSTAAKPSDTTTRIEEGAALLQLDMLERPMRLGDFTQAIARRQPESRAGRAAGEIWWRRRSGRASIWYRAGRPYRADPRAGSSADLRAPFRVALAHASIEAEGALAIDEVRAAKRRPPRGGPAIASSSASLLILYPTVALRPGAISRPRPPGE